MDRGFAELALITFQRLERGARDNRQVVPWKVITGKQFADFHLHQFEQFRVIDHVGFVEVNHNIGDTYLPGEQNMLAGLGHRAVRR